MPLSYPLSRRRFVAQAAGAVAGLVVGPALVGPEGQSPRAVPLPRPQPKLPKGLFTLGVASGDPEPDGVVLWTRLAPVPLAGGGMPDLDVEVDWEVAEDERFRQIAQRGTALAEPRLGHSVHVELVGLKPAREYWYRFRVGSEASPIGRTITAPAADESPRRLRFAFASCQDFATGYFTPYPHMIDEDVSFVIFLGDYIYENGPTKASTRLHEGVGEPYSVGEYRNRHAQYRTDPDLRKAHSTVPWIVTLDDHEIDNNWADEHPQDPNLQTPAAFRARRVAALQAYYEHMPLRRRALPHGLEMQLYRRLNFGPLASLHVLDTRQYRSTQASSMAHANDPAMTMTGEKQEEWLVRSMKGGARWNLLANQVMWAQNDRVAGLKQTFDMDCWDGYRAQRRRLLEFFGSGLTSNPVVLTGDRHATWVCDLKPDFDDPASPVVGAELTGTSITSGGDWSRVDFHRMFDPIMTESPHWKFIDNRRGYMVCELTADSLQAALRTVDTVLTPASNVVTAARFEVQAGVPGVRLVSTES
ncbi:MAG: alkaline phosphatase D family protein [Kibdelosporangium sp.]